MSRVWNTLVAATQSFNAATGGDPDQTYSGRTALEAEAGDRWAIIREAMLDLLFALFAGQRHHCASSIERDEVRVRNLHNVGYRLEVSE